MARLDNVLARWLLRRIKRGPADDETSALSALAERQAHAIERHRETAEKRSQIHKQLKRRHQALKQELKAAKELARERQHAAWRLEQEQTSLREQVAAMHHALASGLESPGLPQLPLQPPGSNGHQIPRNPSAVWRHSMRLGVLRQYEPRSLRRETFPATTPPGESSSWPRFTIVTPSFRQAKFLERTLLSVLEQDYPHVDYHVQDGGSTDGSVEIIKGYQGRLGSWRSEPDGGPAEAINRGFAGSQGSIMAWLNSDDLLMPGALRHVASYFAKHPEVDAVYGHRIVIDERDWEVGRWVLPRHDGELLLWVDYVPQETLFWRRSLWERVGAHLDESYKFAFDWDLLLRFMRCGARIVRLPRFLGCFRVHDAQKSTVEINTVGAAEVARLRERELRHVFSEHRLGQQVIRFQGRAVWHDRLLRWGVRW